MGATISWREALERIQKEIVSGTSETIPVSFAAGRTLASSLVSRYPLPPFDNSAMDGFAVQSADSNLRAELRVTFTQAAGASVGGTVGANEAALIMTGGEIPSGADSVVRLEDTETVREGSIRIIAPVKPGNHIRRKGEDVAAGSEILSAGISMTAGEVGLIAAAGLGHVNVIMRPTVAIVPTGSEIVEPGVDPSGKAVFNSNAPMLEAASRRDGAEIFRMPVVRDDRDELKRTLEKALTNDVVLTTGGVSVGAFDYMREVLESLDVEIVFHRVAIRPGKPVLFGVRRSPKTSYVFGLPGNPVSALVTYEVFARPLVLALGGKPFCGDGDLRVSLVEPIAPKPGLTWFIVGMAWQEDGKLVARPAPLQGSHRVGSLRGANVILRIEGLGQAVKACEAIWIGNQFSLA